MYNAARSKAPGCTCTRQQEVPQEEVHVVYNKK